MMKSILIWLYRVICVFSMFFVLLWFIIIGQSSIPVFSSLDGLLGLYPYQMNGSDRWVLEFQGGILGDANAAFKVSEFYEEYGERSSQLYWLHKSAMLGNKEAASQLEKCSPNNMLEK